ncbi:related to tRNA (guanine(37)-N1)-methyltransferase [Hanseniaspora guilliermondii]|uniref:tRNA (guanine(37)-N1)-methyltransferase n=1 Tax=Hanseniaspora guilliermondii TaxID=56406 RepID=A0A1L0AVQ9_9ASCO|nr:related to tRNA (guanine(37)-N1)-methyltransferase [Hanseniaspora guilliermondii]
MSTNVNNITPLSFTTEQVKGRNTLLTKVLLPKDHILKNIAYKYNINNEIVDIENKDCLFKGKINCYSILIKDPKLIGKISKTFNNTGDLLRIMGQPSIVGDEHTNYRKVLFSPNIQKFEDLSEGFQKFLKEEHIITHSNDKIFKPHVLTFDYSYWSAQEIISTIIPNVLKEKHEDINDDLIESPVSYSVTGDIAHLNLRSQFNDARFLIGRILIDKISGLNKIVNKMKTIDTKFRTFAMEVIASRSEPYPKTSLPEDMSKDPSFENYFRCQHKESNCVFTLDFSKVYWNSRLQTEHDRLINTFKENDLVIDVMAGIGPFSCPSGKKGVFVISNDLNPSSYEYMQINVAKNNVKNYVQCRNLDGAELIRNTLKYVREFRFRAIYSYKGELTTKTYVKGKDKKRVTKQMKITVPNLPNHYVMNLPETAIEFLNNFKSIYNELEASKIDTLPYVHVHCFEKYGSDEQLSDREIHYRVYKRIIKQFDLSEDNETLPFDCMKFHEVRRVAPCKPMYCVSFQLPLDIVKTN